MKKWLISLLLVAVVVYIVVEFVQTSQNVQPVQQTKTMQATDFTLPTLEGENRTLSAQKGKVVVINFWASWCTPCKQEAPHLQAFYEEHHEDVEILAVNVTSKDKKASVQTFVDQYKLTFPVLLDESGDISTMYGAFTIPTTIILNRDGEVVHEISGPLEGDYLKELTEPLVNG